MKKSVLAVVALMALSFSAFAAVDINTASESQLAAVKGIGPVKAKSIVEYRMQHGDFKAVKDLEKVPGFSRNTVSKLSKELRVMQPATNSGGNTPAAPKQK